MRNTPFNLLAEQLGNISETTAPILGFQVDSRRIGPGELFFALPGEKTDGHCFLADVQQRGGIGAVVSKSYGGPEFGLELIRVDHVIASLQKLAADAIRRSSAQIVAVTGTMGKTTTKDFIATLLEAKFRVGKTYASYNTKLTLPITILNMRGDEEVLVLEMGMGEPGDIEKLVQIAPPDVAVLTQVAMAHYGDFFPDGTEGIAKAKAEIFHHPKTKKAIFYHGLAQFPSVVESIGCEKVTFSLEDRGADYFLSNGILYDARLGLVNLEDHHKGPSLNDLTPAILRQYGPSHDRSNMSPSEAPQNSPNPTVRRIDERGVRAYCFADFPFQQQHVLHNFLAAVSVARTLKMEWDQINAQVSQLRLPKMRFEMFEQYGIVLINDAYNANPESMKAALRSLPEPKSGGKRIAVLGQMSDLGPYSTEMHEAVGRFAQEHVDHLLTFFGDASLLNQAFAEAKKPAEHFTELSALVKRLQELSRPGDVVLVKGSRALSMEKIFEELELCSCS